MPRHPLLLALLVPLLPLACRDPEPPAPPPEPTPAPVPEKPEAGEVAEVVPAPADEGADKANPEGEFSFPLWTFRTPPVGATYAVPAASSVVAFDVDPPGAFALVALGSAKPGPDTVEPGGLLAWDFTSPPKPIAVPRLADRAIEDVAFSRVTPGLVFTVSRNKASWFLDAFRFESGALTHVRELFADPKRLLALTSAPVGYGNRARLYFGREYASGKFHVLSVFEDGERLYEVTSETGTLSDLSQSVRPSPDDETSPPLSWASASALPLSVLVDGTLLYAEVRADGPAWRPVTTHEKSYETGIGANWSEKPARKLDTPTGTLETDTAQGFYRLRWTAGTPGAQLVARSWSKKVTVAKEATFVLAPKVVGSGRTLLGVTRTDAGHELRLFPVDAPLAGVRYLDRLHLEGPALDLLDSTGFLGAPSEANQIYGPYERWRYDPGCGWMGDNVRPVFASIDGFLELLSLGFSAVVMNLDRRVSIPRFRAVAEALRMAGEKQKLDRLVRLARVTLALLDGDDESAEGKLILAEAKAVSTVHTFPVPQEVDYAEFKPLGFYATTEEFKRYWHAFKLLTLVQFSPEEQAALAADDAFTSALSQWHAPFQSIVSGSRHPLWFGESKPHPFTRPECIPTRGRSRALFPLGWGPDSEIIEGGLAHLDVADECTVKDRAVPSGLDLLAVLGSKKAAQLHAPEYAKFPELKAVHATLAARYAATPPPDGVVDGWLSLVRTIAAQEVVPERVSPDLWQRRLQQTALGSWVGYRHTMLLYEESGAVECGGAFFGFEIVRTEPPHGVVDPLPDAWAQVAGLVRELAVLSRSAFPEFALAAELEAVAKVAEAFGGMAQRQMRGEALSSAEYGVIDGFSGEVEHPLLRLKSLGASDTPREILVPDPMAVIARVTSGAERWHVALGKPIEVVALLGDRGIHTPATGAVYSYYEHVAPQALTDEEWREQLPKARRPAWVQPILNATPALILGRREP